MVNVGGGYFDLLEYLDRKAVLIPKQREYNGSPSESELLKYQTL